MKSPAITAALLHSLEHLRRCAVDPRSVLLLSSSGLCSMEAERLVSHAFPAAAHEVRVLSPGSFLRYLTSLCPARLVGMPSPDRALGTRASLGAALWRLPLGDLRPPTAPEKHLDDLARLFNDLLAAGVSSREYAARCAALDAQLAGEEEEPFSGARQRSAAAYAAWLAANAAGGGAGEGPSGSALALLTMMHSEPVGAAALRAAVQRDTQHVLCANADALDLGVARLLYRLLGPGARAPAASPADAAAADPAAVGASLDAATAAAAAAAGALPLGSVRLFMDAGPPLPFGRWARAPLLRRMAEAAALQPTASGAPDSPRAYTWTVQAIDHGASLCSAPIAAAARSVHAGGSAAASAPASASKASSWGGSKGKAADAAAGIPPASAPSVLPGLPPSVRYVQALDGATASAGGKGGGRGFVECIGIGPDLDANAVVAQLALALARGEGGAAAAAAPAPLSSPRVVAVLCRSNAEAADIAARCDQLLSSAPPPHTHTTATATATASIPAPPRVYVEAKLPLARVPEVRWLLSVLSLLANPADPQHWYTLATSPLYGLPTHLVGAWVRAALAEPMGGGILFQALRVAGDVLEKEGGARSGVVKDFAVHARQVAEVAAGSSTFSSASASASSISDLIGLAGGAEQDFFHALPSSPTPSDTALTSFTALPPPPKPILTPAATAATAALLTHLRATLAHYHATRSVTQALVKYLSVSGLEGVLTCPETPGEAQAASAVTGLLTLCTSLESVHGVAGGRGRAQARARSALFGEGKVGGVEVRGHAAAPQPLQGLFLVSEGLSAAVYGGGADFYALGRGGTGGGAAGALLGVGEEVEEEGAALLLQQQLLQEGGLGAPSAAAAAAAAATEGGGEGSATAGLLPTAADACAVTTHAQIEAALGSTDIATLLSNPSFSPPATPLALPLQALAPPLTPGSSGTVYVTTASRGTAHMYDCVLLPNFTSRSHPGPYTPSPLQPYPSVFALPGPWEGMGEFPLPGGATATPLPGTYPPSSLTRAQRDAEVRALVADCVQRAREGVVFTCPAAHPDFPVTSTSSRAALIDDIFGAAPTAPRAGKSASKPAPPTPTTPSDAEFQLSPPPPSSTAPRLSYSAVTDYEWCPQKYRLGRVDKLPTPRTLPMLYGGALHASLALCGEIVGTALCKGVGDVLGGSSSSSSSTPTALPLAYADVAARVLAELTREGAKEARAHTRSLLPTPAALAAAMHAAYRANWRSEDKRTWGASFSPADDTSSSSSSSGSSLLSAAEWSEPRVNEYLAAAALAAHSPRTQLAVLDGVARAACERFAALELGALQQWLSEGGSAGTTPPPAMPALIEAQFSVTVGGVRVAGVMDRVDVMLDRDSWRPYLRVREFKSSQQWKRRGAGGKSPLFAQLARGIQSNLYGIAVNSLRGEQAWGTDFAPPPAGSARRRGGKEAVGDVLVALEAIECDMVEERVVGAHEREAAEARTVAVAGEIVAGRFPATPSEIHCLYCNFSAMCPQAWGKPAAVSMARLEGARASVVA